LCQKNAERIIKGIYQANSMQDIENNWNKPELKQEIQRIALSTENFFKLAIIFLRYQANLSTLIMGETGIGKTALVKLLSKIMVFEYISLDVHAGTEKKHIIEKIE